MTALYDKPFNLILASRLLFDPSVVPRLSVLEIVLLILACLCKVISSEVNSLEIP